LRRTLRLERLEDRALPSGTTSLTGPLLSFTALKTAEARGFLATPDAVDLYGVNLMAGEQLTARIHAQDSGSGLHGVLRVFRSDGTPVALDEEPGRDPQLSFQADSKGEYFLGISAAGNNAYDPNQGFGTGGSTTGMYALDLRLQAAAPLQPNLVARSFHLTTNTASWGSSVTATFTVENRGGATAGAFSFLVRLSGSNRFNGPNDLTLTPVVPVQFNGLAAGTSRTAQVTVTLPAAPAGFPAPAAVFLGLVGSSGTPVATDGPADGDGWDALQIVAVQPAPGTNPTRATAAALVPGTQVVGAMGASGTAWYQVTVTAPGQLAAHLTADTRLSLYDARGALLVQSVGQSAADPDPLILQHVDGSSGGTTYYLEVDGSPSARYTLMAGFTPAISAFNFLGADGAVTGVVTADFNGDGHPDLAAAGRTVNVFLGVGDGTFQPALAFNYGHVPYVLALGDFNDDGVPDVVAVNTGGNHVSVLLGNGDGSFRTAADFAIGSDLLDVVTGDFANNGHDDIAVCDAGQDMVWVYAGNGDGTFQAVHGYRVKGGPTAIVAGDFNGDGTFDLATADQDTSAVSVLLGKGDGTFRSAVQTRIEDSSGFSGVTPEDLVAGYFHGPNKPLDLATADLDSNDVTILTGNGNGTFHVGDYVAVGTNPVTLAAGDLSGDGKTDLVVANRDDSDITVLTGKGDGTFAELLTTATSRRPVDLAIGDFNQDGLPDVAAAGKTNSNVAILLNQGAGLLPNLAHIPTVADSQAFVTVTADFNRDGIPDFAVANIELGTVSVFLGNGDGTFRSTGQFVAGDDPLAIAVGDFNGDNIPDLITDGGSYSVDVLLGRGDGTFGPPIVTANLSISPDALVADDFTGDGLCDVAIADSFGNQVEVLAGDGTGHFTELSAVDVNSYPVALASAEFDHDGFRDLAVACEDGNTVDILINQGDGTFVDQESDAVGTQPIDVITADVNHDGHTDVVTANLGDTVSVLLGNGDGTFQSSTEFDTGGSPQFVAAGDFNHDGNLDLATVNFDDSTVSVLQGDGQGSFTTNGTYDVGLQTQGLAVADFNRDGLPDLVTANKGDTNLSLLLDQPGGTFAPARPMSLDLRVQSLITDDWNHDHQPDLVRASIREDSLEVAVNSGDGFFITSSQDAAGSAHAVALGGDFNGDGREDLAVANADTQDVNVLLGYGNGGFLQEQTLSLPGVPTALAVGDFNGDGNADLAVAVSGPGEVEIWLGTGDGHFKPGGRFAVGWAPVALVAGDFDHDGHLDLAAADAGSGDVAVLHGRGDGTFAAAQFYAVGAAPQGLAAADLNGDGFLDLVAVDEDSNDVTVLLGQADGTFRSAGQFAVGSGPVAVAIADLNGDGHPDLAVADKLSGQVTLLFGRGDGSFQSGGTFGVGLDPIGVVSADFNADGRPDLAVASQDSPNFGVELGIGNGTFFSSGQVFAPTSATPLPGQVTGVPDVTVLNEGGRILVRPIDRSQAGLLGAPRFVNPPTDPSDPTSGFPARAIALLTVAGQPEIVALDARDNGLSFYAFNPGAGTFMRTAGPQVPGNLPTSLAVGDLNGDGRDDLVVSDLASDEVVVYLQTPTGAFAATPDYTLATGAAPSSVTLTDVDGDGRLDIVTTNQFSGDVSVFRNTAAAPFATEERFRAGSGPYQLGTLATGGTVETVHSRDNPVAVVAGPFTGAGNDLVVLDRFNASTVLLASDGHGGLYNPQAPLSLPPVGSGGIRTTTLVAGAFGPSSNLDLAVLDAYDSRVLLFAGDGAGHFTALPPVSAGDSPTGLAVADLNGDGHPDLLVGDQSGDVLVLEGTGAGGFEPPPPTTGQRVPLDLQVVNGQPMVLLANQRQNRVLVETRDPGSPQFTPTQTIAAVNAATPFAPADAHWYSLDQHSGLADAVVLGSASNNLLVYRYNTTTGRWAPTSYPVGTDPVGVTMADVNGDHVPDLLVANQGSNDISILYGSWDAHGQWVGQAGPRLQSGGTGPVAVTVRTLPGNPNPDLVVTDGQSGTFSILPGRGQGFFDDRSPAVLQASNTGLRPPSFFGNGTSGVATTGDGELLAFDLNNFAGSLRVAFAAEGASIAAVQARTGGDVVAALDGGTVLDLRPDGSGSLTVAATFQSLGGIPSDPSALELLETATGPQALVTEAGGDRVFVFALPQEAPVGSGVSLEPEAPSTPTVEVTASSSGTLTLVATLVADVLPQGEAAAVPGAAAPPEPGPSPERVAGGDELGTADETVVAKTADGIGLDVDEKLRRLDLYEPTRDPAQDGASSRLPFAWPLDPENVLVDRAIRTALAEPAPAQQPLVHADADVGQPLAPAEHAPSTELVAPGDAGPAEFHVPARPEVAAVHASEEASDARALSWSVSLADVGPVAWMALALAAGHAGDPEAEDSTRRPPLPQGRA
jgi:hypothetical protein